MLIPLVAIAAAVTLLPVMLAAWGPALDRHRVALGSTTFSRGWERWGRLVVRRRWVAGAARARDRARPRGPGALDEHRPAHARTRSAATGQPAQTLHALERQGVPERGRVPDPGTHPRRHRPPPGRGDRRAAPRRLHRAGPADALVPPRPGLADQRDPDAPRATPPPGTATVDPLRTRAREPSPAASRSAATPPRTSTSTTPSTATSR